MKAVDAILLIVVGGAAGWFAKQAYDNHKFSVLKNTEGCPNCNCEKPKVQGFENGFVKRGVRL